MSESLASEYFMGDNVRKTGGKWRGNCKGRHLLSIRFHALSRWLSCLMWAPLFEVIGVGLWIWKAVRY